MHKFSPFFYTEAKFEPLEKKAKKIDITRYENFQTNSRVHPFFDHKRNEEILEEWKVERETKKIQIKLVTTCNKNEQQQDAKNNAEL